MAENKIMKNKGRHKCLGRLVCLKEVKDKVVMVCSLKGKYNTTVFTKDKKGMRWTVIK